MGVNEVQRVWEIYKVNEVQGVQEVYEVNEVQGVQEIYKVKGVQGVQGVYVVNEVQGVQEVYKENEVQGVQEVYEVNVVQAVQEVLQGPPYNFMQVRVAQVEYTGQSVIMLLPLPQIGPERKWTFGRIPRRAIWRLLWCAVLGVLYAALLCQGVS